MTWSVQLSIWALPPLLAVLVVLRDLGYLWPRRREPATLALLTLAIASGTWAFLNLVSIMSPALEFKEVLEIVQYVPGSVAPVAWVWFALAFTRRRADLSRWPMLVLVALSLITVGLSIAESTEPLLVRETALVDLGSVVGLQVAHGSWHWVFLLVRNVAVVGATVAIARYLVRIPESRHRIAIAAVASVAALTPELAHLGAMPGAAWADLTATGFALASSLMGVGLLRPRLRALGPVARAHVLDELRDPLVVLDGRGRVVDVNRAAERVLGLRPYGDVPIALGTLWASSRSEPHPRARITLEANEGDGQRGPRIYEVTSTPLGDPDALGHTALVLRDLTAQDRMERELRNASEELERLANTDPLTGLANRRHFMEVLNREIERAERYERPLSLVLLDLDHFKKVNDTHGHAAGDDVLKEAAQALLSVCRDVDLAARWGGEELALLLPETDGFGARTVAERVRERIAARGYSSPSGQAFRVTGSLGVASLSRDIATGEALLQATDEALYQAKAAGRNRVVVLER